MSGCGDAVLLAELEHLAGKPRQLDSIAAQEIEPRATDRPLLERAFIQARISSLLERASSSKEDLRPQITALAVEHRIMTPYTAMLVLETDWDFARFGIDRRAGSAAR